MVPVIPLYHAAFCPLGQLVKLELTVAYQAKKRAEQRLLVVVVAQPSDSKDLDSNFERIRRVLEKNYGCSKKGLRVVASIHKGLVDNCWHLGSRRGMEGQAEMNMSHKVLRIYEVGKEIDVVLAVVVPEGPEESKEM